MVRAPWPLPPCFAAISRRRGSRLPAHGEESAPRRCVEAIDQVVLLVERVLDAQSGKQRLVEVVPRGEVEHRVARLLHARKGHYVSIAAFARSRELRT